MTLKFQSCLSTLVILILVVTFTPPQNALAQGHVVSAADLHRDILAAAQAREGNQDKVLKFFSSDQAKKALQSANLPYEKVQKAVSQLSDEELDRLAGRTEKVRKDFAAGALTNQQITYIIIALATALIVVIIVVAR